MHLFAADSRSGFGFFISFNRLFISDTSTLSLRASSTFMNDGYNRKTNRRTPATVIGSAAQMLTLHFKLKQFFFIAGNHES